MNIHLSRARYFHDVKPKEETVKDQETVEEWQARTGKTPEIIKSGVENYKTEMQKAEERKIKNREMMR